MSAQLLTDILDVLEKRGVQVSAIIAGDVKLVLASPWPAPKAVTIHRDPQVTDVEKDRQGRPSRLTPAQLVLARAESRRTFGRVLPDEMLEDFVEAGQL